MTAALLGCGLALLLLASLTSVTRAATPNLILFSVDDDLVKSSWEDVYTKTIVASGARNPNGCRPPATWFTACCAHGRKTAECDMARLARSKGHELATHTKSHSKETANFTLADWKWEIDGQRKWLAGCGIPSREVVGFRAPYFTVNAAMGQALHDLGFLYDSSLSGRDPAQPPFPLRSNPPSLDCPASGGPQCQWTSLRRIWEVPAYILPGKGPLVGQRVDPQPATNMTVIQRLRADFERKRGTGVPVSVMVHPDYLDDSETRQPIVDFLRWASAQPDTWVVTYSQLIHWLKMPPGTPIAKVLAQYICDAS